MDELNQTLGQRIRSLRRQRGKSQRELSAPGLSYAYISRIEKGTRNPSAKALNTLAAKLGVSVAFLEGRPYDWHDVVRDALFTRILDDPRYCQHRLGRIPRDREVWEAVDKHVSAAVDRLAEALDPIESDVWSDLENP